MSSAGPATRSPKPAASATPPDTRAASVTPSQVLVARATLSHTLATFAAQVSAADIPAEVAASARLRVLDTVGVCLASVGMDYANAVHDVVAEQGAADDATLFGRRSRSAASWAAFHNGALAHGNDFDDTHSVALMHISGVVVPTVLAMGERHKATGAQVLAALIAAYEIGLRIGMAAPSAFHARGFHATGVCGVFAAVAGAGRILDLDPAQMQHALGIALSQAAGSLEFLVEGASTKRMHPGWAGHAGIVAAQLAARGFTGPSTALEGRYGLLRAYAGVAAPDYATFARDLGETWETLNIGFKPYPCGHISHPYMDCARALRERHALTPAQIAAIELRVPQAAVPILCEPVAEKRRPANPYAARFSLPFAVALVLKLGYARIGEFSAERLRDRDLHDLMDRTTYVVDTSLPYPKGLPGWIRIKLHDGSMLEERMDASRGSRELPMSDEDLYAKFADNASRVFAKSRVDAIWEGGRSFDRLDDIGTFTRLLAS
jgi:2-methylcitrate dehydratase PrpD